MQPTEQTPLTRESSNLLANSQRGTRILCILLAVVTVALYSPVTRHPFVNYDDDRYVTENVHVRHGLTADTLTWALTSTEQANWHPLTWMSHALDYSLFRLNPAGHHLSSVVLHTLNVILLFLLLKWATDRLWPSLFVAVLFAVHPINVESVAWIAERKNVLCTFFFFLTLWAYGWYVRKPDWKRYVAVAVLFAAGLASKPMLITLPFVLLLLDYWPLRRVHEAGVEGNNTWPAYSWPRLATEKLLLLVLSAASAFITMRAQRAGGAVRTTAEFPFLVRVANAVYAYSMYLWKMVWPARLAPFYPHPGYSLARWQVLLATLTLLAITAVTLKFRTRRYLLVGWLWFLGTLVPVIGLVQVGNAAMADRYAYIPLIGIFVMIAFGAADWAEKQQLGLWTAVPAAAILIALALTAHRQIGYWQSNVGLWSHALAVTKNNFVAEDNLGGALILEGKEEQAYPHFVAAARINPRDPMSRSNLGTYYQTHNRISQAIEQYQAAIALTSDPGLRAQTYANLGMAQQAIGEDDDARKSFNQSMRLNPLLPNSWLGIGLLARKQGKLQEAIDDLTYSIRLRPSAETYLELGRTFAQAGQIPMARGSYQRALQIDPKLTAAQQAIDDLPQSP